MSEQIIKSAVPGFHDIVIAKASDCIVIAKSIDGHPTAPMVAIPVEDITNLIKALQPIANEINERNSL